MKALQPRQDTLREAIHAQRRREIELEAYISELERVLEERCGRGWRALLGKRR